MPSIGTMVVLLVLIAIVIFAIKNVREKGSCDCGSNSCPQSKNYKK
ncbi:MAG: FeoB-associated Cys-rich membrane protein [Tissierellia bacterium]|nr:FeoB-associated Cys-rich membrane protein [Tissierellia bacterium]